jgi:import inner membrane translocase subunit TIM9
VVARCFDQCVYRFSSKMLDSGESGCLENCAEKYLKSTSRVGLRFQEIQAQQQAAQQGLN